MTTEELFAELKDLRKEMLDNFEKQREEHKELHKEFYVFKGKAMQFMSIVSIIFAFVSDYIKKKMGM